MDRRPGSIDYDDIIQRYGRRLFVIAYHLTGTAREAEELSRECLIRSLLAPDFPAADKEAGVFLHRGLISLWGERAGLPGREESPSSEARASTWPALSRLDAVSRSVLVLRVAEGLEYETIGKVMSMAPDVVYARLLQARGGLREGERAIQPSLFETMNLYLDDRLPRDQRAVFERCIQTDPALRERVEFHRGLTLELHEEAPPLPRDFLARLRERLESTLETLLLVDQATESVVLEIEPASVLPAPVRAHIEWWKSPWTLAAAALVVLVAGIALGQRLPRRAPVASKRTGGPEGAASPSGTPDEATVEALRSLGYLAPSKEKPRKDAKGQPAPTPARTPKTSSAPGAAARKTAPPPVAEATAPPARRPTPAPSATPSTQPAPAAAETPAASPAPALPVASPSATPPQAGEITWRVIPVPMEPGTETEPRVIRTAAGWAALFDDKSTPPEIAFGREMVLLLPARLAIETVTALGEALVVTCHREQVDPGEGPASASSVRLAVVVPISDLPVRLAVR